MKKVLLVFIMLTVLGISGCGNAKKLECEQIDEENQEVYTYLLKYNKSGNLKSIMFKTVFKNYVENDLSLAEQDELKSECDDINDLGLKNLDCKVNIKNRDVEVVVTATDVDKMKSDEISLVELDDFVYYNYDGMKKEIENWGFICK